MASSVSPCFRSVIRRESGIRSDSWASREASLHQHASWYSPPVIEPEGFAVRQSSAENFTLALKLFEKNYLLFFSPLQSNKCALLRRTNFSNWKMRVAATILRDNLDEISINKLSRVSVFRRIPNLTFIQFCSISKKFPIKLTHRVS